MSDLITHRPRSAASIGFVLSVILAVGAEGQEAPREDGQWTMPAKDYAATRYSGLRELTAANAAGLRPGRTFPPRVRGVPRRLVRLSGRGAG